MKETDLYLPVKNLLLSQGFEVRAEIKNIDILASKDDFYCAVELKTKPSLKLIYQAIDRQKTADQVFIAIPKSAVNMRRSPYRNFVYLLRRLEIGLILVSQEEAEVVFDATAYDMEKSRARYKNRKSNMLKEYRLRKSNQNIAGTKGKTMTLYKEQVLKICAYLLKHGQVSIKEIKEATKIEKTASILQKNYDGYFIRVSRGIYQLTDTGRVHILKYTTQSE